MTVTTPPLRSRLYIFTYTFHQLFKLEVFKHPFYCVMLTMTSSGATGVRCYPWGTFDNVFLAGSV